MVSYNCFIYFIFFKTGFITIISNPVCVYVSEEVKKKKKKKRKSKK